MLLAHASRHGQGVEGNNNNKYYFDVFKSNCMSDCRGGGHNGRKSLILAPQEIPDISGYQLGFGRRFVKAYNTENPVTNQKIL